MSRIIEQVRKKLPFNFLLNVTEKRLGGESFGKAGGHRTGTGRTANSCKMNHQVTKQRETQNHATQISRVHCLSRDNYGFCKHCTILFTHHEVLEESLNLVEDTQ